MVFDHVGIMNEDEEGAVRFYRDLLGLEKIRESSVPPALIRRAEEAGVKVISAERGGRTVWFLEDFSGNRIEVKQAG